MQLQENNVKFVTNNYDSNVYQTIKELFYGCKSFYISVAFINFNGFQLLIDTFDEMKKKGIKGKILTSDYLCFTDPESIKRLNNLDNIETKVFLVKDNNRGFHSKGYIFEYEDCYKILIGSSNITQSALKSNVEWNLQVISKKDSEIINMIIDEFNELMDLSYEVNDEFIIKYENYYKKIKKIRNNASFDIDESKGFVPNYFQELALENLQEFRNSGKDKAIVIAATGVGKTYASVFDVETYNPSKMLYIVHNENILNSAKKSFQNVIKDKTMGLFVGRKREIEKDYIFTSIQTISRDNNLSLFKKDYFDYIIIDECHRAYSPSYKKVLDYYKPKFLLGMTATPDRTDGGNVYKLFDYNIASDIRMEESLNHDLLCPFHYFGIRDNIDLSNIDYSKVDEIAEALMAAENRVSFIIKMMEHYGHDGDKRKCIGFCANKKHAQFMADAFNLAGYKSVCLTGEDKPKFRDECIKKLEDDKNDLECIFTVDIFNEGIDIPSVNLILMLRPTTSPIIFTQQLGRGLRKTETKEFLTVLDFISNYNRNYMIALALTGKQYDKDGVAERIKHGFDNYTGNTTIELDPITKKEIIDQLNNTNFNKLNYLRSSYNDFSAHIGKKIINMIDYIKDGAPDPIKYIRFAGNYLSFLCKVVDVFDYEFSKDEIDFLNYITKFIPLRRINEYVFLRMLIDKKEVNLTDFHNKLNEFVENVSINSAKHTFNLFKGKYWDSSELKKYKGYFKFSNGFIKFGTKANKILSNKIIYEHLLDLIEYGIITYVDDFGKKNYGDPFLKLYETYSMRDLGKLTNYSKIESSIRGSGVWVDENNNFYLFVDINKSLGIKENINYDDYFKSKKIFHWQSPNDTKQDSKYGKVFINNLKQMHLFVRKERKVDSVTMPFIYVGKVKTINYYGEKPITIDFELEYELPKPIFNEMKKEVKK